MQTFLVVMVFVSSLLLVVSVLSQDGKNAGIGSSFGGSTEKLFGKHRARGLQAMLQRVTVISATLFMLVVLLLNVYIGWVSNDPGGIL